MMPFAIVGALCVLAFVFGLFFIIGRNSVRNAAPSEQETTISPVSVYLSTYEGYVAIFTSDSTDPYQISNVPVSSLSPEIAAQLEAHVLASSLDDAKARVEQYRASMTESAPVSQSPGSTTESLTAASLPKTWNGHFEGYSQYAENGSIDRTVQMTFSEVSDDGHISGLCSIGEGDTGPGSGTGSYYIEGTIDWNTRAIELHGTDWAEQGDLKYMRRYEGIVSEAFDSLNGTCAFDDGSRSGAWQMVAY